MLRNAAFSLFIIETQTIKMSCEKKKKKPAHCKKRLWKSNKIMKRSNVFLKKENKQTLLIPKAPTLQHILLLIYYLLYLSVLSRPAWNFPLHQKITTRMDR